MWNGIRSGQKFCHECGSVIKEVSECPDCGTEVLPTQKFCHECGSPIRTVKADKEPKCMISLPEFDIDDSLEYLDAVKVCFRQLELDNSYVATLKYAELLQDLEENSEALEDEDHEDYWMFSLKKSVSGVDECPMRLMILNILHNPSAYEEALQYFEEAVSDPVQTSLIIDDSEPRYTTEAYYGLYGLYLAHSLGHGVPQNKLKACQYLKRFEEHSRHLNLGIQVMLDVHIALAYDALDDNKASVKKYLYIVKDGPMTIRMVLCSVCSDIHWTCMMKYYASARPSLHHYRNHGRETLINNCLNAVAKLLERFKRAKKDFFDVLTLDNFVKAETEKLWIE